MQTARLWFARIVLLYAVLICGFLAWIYFVNPQSGLAPFGVSLSGEPHSASFIRTGIGAFFVTQLVIAAAGLARPRWLAAALGLLALINGIILAGRVLGIALDGVSPMQWSELRTEGISWLVFVAAFVAALPFGTAPHAAASAGGWR